MTKPRIEEMIEEFANIEHERWSNWQKYLHSRCFKSPEFTGALIIPADLVARWERQIATPYVELSEKEKQSDREQVYPYIKALTKAHQAGIDEAVEIFERFIEDIPEAYGWGEEDEEADRGYQICSKNVKAIGRSLIKALQDNKLEYDL